MPIDEIFAELGKDPMLAARKMLRYLKQPSADASAAKDFMDAARVLVFLKGNDAHDYKFSSAVLEDYYHVSPEWRDVYLASNVFKLRSSQGPRQRVGRTNAGRLLKAVNAVVDFALEFASSLQRQSHSPIAKLASAERNFGRGNGGIWPRLRRSAAGAASLRAAYWAGAIRSIDRLRRLDRRDDLEADHAAVRFFHRGVDRGQVGQVAHLLVHRAGCGPIFRRGDVW